MIRKRLDEVEEPVGEDLAGWWEGPRSTRCSRRGRSAEGGSSMSDGEEEL